MRRLIHLSTIIADLGDIFLFVAPFTCVPLLITLLYREWNMLIPMGSVPVILFLAGITLRRFPRSERGVRLSTALASVALFWFCIALISGIPFMLGLRMEFTNALFEGMAGWTGTAFSLMPGIDTAPRTLLFWRSFMQWISGIGIIAFAITTASSTGLFASKIFRTEGRDEALLPSVIATGRSLWKIYAFLTFMAVGLILFSGLSLWESVNLALSAISTGGFCIHQQGIAYYDSYLLELLLIPVMIAGALPFRLYYLVLENRRLSLFGDEQVKLFLALLGIAVAILWYDLMFFRDLPIPAASQQALFMAVSALTTTGFQTANLHSWASVTLLFLAMVAFIGGCSGSTSGGIKINRVALAIRALVWWFQRLFVSGKVLLPFKIEGKIIPKATAELEVAKNMLVIILAVITVFCASLAVLQFHLTSFSFTEVIFELVSAFSTSGISTGYVSPDMPFISKWIFILVMWIGRLEVIPVVMLFFALAREPE